MVLVAWEPRGQTTLSRQLCLARVSTFVEHLCKQGVSQRYCFRLVQLDRSNKLRGSVEINIATIGRSEGISRLVIQRQPRWREKTKLGIIGGRVQRAHPSSRPLGRGEAE